MQELKKFQDLIDICIKAKECNRIDVKILNF